MIYLPVAGRLEGLSAAEVELRTLTLDGILAVQAGDNPRVVAEKLNSYIAPIDRLRAKTQKVADIGERERGRGGLMPRGGSRRRRRRTGGEHESKERWLLTYSDMITLLLALFIVLFSISSVNISKFISLQESLKAAFSGSILTGGRSILERGCRLDDEATRRTTR